MVKIFFFIFLILILLCYKKNEIIKGGNKDIIDKLDKIYFINLDKSKDRLDKMLEQSKDFDLNLTRYPAIYGKDINRNKLIKNKILHKKNELRNGELGVTLSHINIWKESLKNNNEYILVLEDDILFCDNFKNELNKYYKQIPEDWDIIYLGGSRMKGKKISENILKLVYDKIPNAGTNMGAYAMLLNKKSIKKLLSLMTPIITPIDLQIAQNNKDLNMYYCNPRLVKHNDNFFSEIILLDRNKKHKYHSVQTQSEPIIVKGGNNNILEKIDKFYFINLDKSKDRLDLMLKYSKDLNLKLERFPAVYGSNLNRNNLIEKGILDKNNKLGNGEIGCFLSHINIWKKALKRKYKYILILEDDIIFTDNFKNNLIKYYNQVPDNWDIIHLGGSRIKGKLINKNIIKPVFDEKISGENNMGTYAMLLSRKGIKKLLDIVIPIKNPIDMQIALNNKKLNIYYTEPKLIVPNNDFYSEIYLIDNKQKLKYRNERTHSDAIIVKGGLNKIPKVIYLCYKTKNIPDYIIPNWKKLNPDYEIKLYDNNDCINFLRDNFGSEHVDTFNYIKDGPIKADFWRCCIIYKYGGVYADIDIKPVKPINFFLEDDTTLLTIRSGYNLNGNGFSLTPELICSKKHNKLLKMCIDTYINWFKNKNKYSYWPWSICRVMTDNFVELIKESKEYNKINYKDDDGNKYQIIHEVIDPKDRSATSSKDHVIYNNKVILYNRYEDYKNHYFR